MSENKHGDGGGEDTHLAGANRIGSLDQAGVVKVLDEVKLRRAHAAAAQRLLRHQLALRSATRAAQPRPDSK